MLRTPNKKKKMSVQRKSVICHSDGAVGCGASAATEESLFGLKNKMLRFAQHDRQNLSYRELTQNISKTLFVRDSKKKIVS